MKEFPFKTIFSALNIKPIVSEDKDKYLALASLEEVRAFLPSINPADVDVLPVAFNACVVNRVNKNDDILNTDRAIATYKNFIYKQINIEHNRKNVIGCILTAGFSEFGTDKPLTETQVMGKTNPFNITLGGVIWKVVNSDLASLIEDSNDPTSSNYMKISASWELGFTDYKIVVLPKGQKNLENGQIINNAEEINKLKGKLICNGGDGTTIDDNRIYRMPDLDVLPLGIGFTERPAADVEGIAVSKADIKEKPVEIESTLKKEEEIKKEDLNKDIISQEVKSNVNIKEQQIFMKITTLKDITDESLKQTNAASIAEFIQSELTKKSGEWETEKNQLTNQLTKAATDHAELTKEQKKLQDQIATLQASVDQFNKEKTEREQVEKFNARMTKINEAYDLDDEVKAALVEEIKSIASDEDFTKWEKKASVLLKGFAKKKAKTKADDKNDDDSDAAKMKKGKNLDCPPADASAAVDDAVDKGKKDKESLPNTQTPDKQSVKDKYQAAFAKENFVIKY